MSSPRSASPRRSSARGLAGPAMCAIFVACGPGEETGSSAFSVRDSAGVEIVESRRPLWSEGGRNGGWRIEPAPFVRIGRQTDDPAYEFADLVGGVLLDDGFAVADGGYANLRFYDAMGIFRRTFGGPGRGPGEFTTLSAVGRTPEGTIWAYDFALRRISWLDTAGSAFSVTTLGPEPPVLGAVGTLPGRSFVLRQLWGAAGTAAATGEGVRRDPAAVVRFDSAGVLADTIGTFAGREVVIHVEDGRGVMTSRPFGRDLAATVRDGRVVVGTQDAARLEEYAPDGTLLRHLRWPEPAGRRVGPAEIRELVESRVEGAPAAERAALRSGLEKLPFPERRPAYRQVLAGPRGMLWVGGWSPPDEATSRWSVFDERGVWLGDVEAPPGVRLLAVGEERILGVERDELDRQLVVVHRLLAADSGTRR